MRSVTSLRAVRTNLSAYAFARGLRGRILQTMTPASARTVSKASVNLYRARTVAPGVSWRSYDHVAGSSACLFGCCT
jgi:hypothetical protein